MSAVVAQVLERAAELCERGWCQIVYARKAGGEGVSAVSRDAVSWCPVGAIAAVVTAARHSHEVRFAAIERLSDAIGSWHIPYWNDTPGRTQAEVVDALRRAAELARSGDG